jgi:hypothetical protein
LYLFTFPPFASPPTPEYADPPSRLARRKFIGIGAAETEVREREMREKVMIDLNIVLKMDLGRSTTVLKKECEREKESKERK